MPEEQVKRQKFGHSRDRDGCKQFPFWKQCSDFLGKVYLYPDDVCSKSLWQVAEFARIQIGGRF